MGRYEQVLAEDKTVIRERFNTDELHLVCPWHGWEYILETGVSAANPMYSLRPFDVTERDGSVYVVVP